MDRDKEILFYNILLVKAEKDIHKFEFVFADLMFSFTSICLDGTLTPSKRNHACVANMSEESTAPIAIVICCGLTTLKWCALQSGFVPVAMLWCLFVWAFFHFTF